MLLLEYHLSVSCWVSVVSHALHVWMCILDILGVGCEYTLRPVSFDSFVRRSGCAACGPGKPLQQERHDWMWLSRCGWDSGPYPDEACQGTQAYLAGDGEEAGGAPLRGEVALGPHSTNPHGGPARPCKVGRKLPSCLGEEGEERTTYPCISDMHLTMK